MEFPEIYQFPPFFTRQAHQETWIKQCTLWSDIILQFCKSKRLFRLSIEDTLPASDSKTTTGGDAKNTTNTSSDGSLFYNKAIQRRLAPDVQREILDMMVKKGHAAWRQHAETMKEPSSSSSSFVCYIYWKSLNEWADLIYEWAENSGLIGTLLTVYEVLQGEGNTRELFYQMDMEVFDQVLVTLQTRGLVELFHDPETASSSHERGLRFLEAN